MLKQQNLRNQFCWRHIRLVQQNPTLILRPVSQEQYRQYKTTLRRPWSTINDTHYTKLHLHNNTFWTFHPLSRIALTVSARFGAQIWEDKFTLYIMFYLLLGLLSTQKKQKNVNNKDQENII